MLLRRRCNEPQVAVPVLWWRSVGNTHTAFVMETMVDEVARAAGTDPVAWRLARLDPKKHARHIAALQLAVDKSGYGKPLPAGHAWGVAIHESFGSVVCYVVDVSISQGRPNRTFGSGVVVSIAIVYTTWTRVSSITLRK